MRYVTLLSEGVRTGPADAYMADAEYRKLTAEWRAMKARVGLSSSPGASAAMGPDGKAITMKGKETQKGGAGRVRAYKEFGTTHSYTIECSCNLFSHANVAYRRWGRGWPWRPHGGLTRAMRHVHAPRSQLLVRTPQRCPRGPR